jgi:multidrug efflux system membrane fusion protein
LRLVDPGNYVQSSDASGLLVITQVQPITVVFTIAEDDVPAVMAKLTAGQQLTAEAYDRSGFVKKLAQGTLLSTDNQINSTSGTLKLKAIFQNEQNTLFPNQFVNIRLLVEMKKEVTIVPKAAIQRGTQNTFVYVVDTSANTVSMQNVVEGTIDGDNEEILSGVSPGDTVVIDGVDKLQNGSQVVLTNPSGGSN